MNVSTLRKGEWVEASKIIAVDVIDNAVVTGER